MRGTSRADVIVSLGGDDRIDGRGGGDVICAGVGDDTVEGGTGRDTVYGGRGFDVCRAEVRDSCALPVVKPLRIVSARVSGSVLELVFSERLPQRTLSGSDIAVELPGDEIVASSAQVVGGRIVAQLAAPLVSDDQATVVVSTTDLVDVYGNLLRDDAPVPVDVSGAPAGCRPYFKVPAGQVDATFEGATNYRVYLRPAGTVRALMLTVDFSDAPATTSADGVVAAWAEPAEHWYGEESYGKMRLQVDSLGRWLRAPKPSSVYNVTLLNGDGIRALIRDVLATADAEVNFANYQIVYVITSRGSQTSYSGAIVNDPGYGFPIDGTEVRYGWVVNDQLRSLVPALAHETGHIFGLPDLYRSNVSGDHQYDWVGAWDAMSDPYLGTGLFAWHRWKLGWLDATQIRCARTQPLETTLTPLELTGAGTKMILVPLSQTATYVIEDRQPIGVDAALCRSGVIIYQIDLARFLWDGAVHILPVVANPETSKQYLCGGPTYDQVLDGTPGRTTFDDAPTGVHVNVAATGGGTYQVSVTRRN